MTISKGVISIGEGAFMECSGLTSIIIPNNVTSIGNSAFANCIGLTSVTIGNGVKYIEDYTFAGCIGLTSFSIPNNVTNIGGNAFYYCTGLTSVTIGNGVTGIGESAFAYCTALTSIKIPNSVTRIDYGAFEKCTALASIEIPYKATNIGDYVFQGCSALASIVVADGNTKYDSRENCNALIESATNKLIVGCKNTKIPNSIITIENYAFSECSGLTSIIIPNSVTSIGANAFEKCSGLASVTIGNRVTTIGDFAFSYCIGMTSIVVANGNNKFDSRDNCNGIIESATNKLIVGCKNTKIPNSVITIGHGAFCYYSSLTSITIPNSVTTIEYYAFLGCKGLTSITIPNSVTNIGNSAFHDCSGLKSITCEAVNPPTCGSNVFFAVSRDIPLYVPVNSILAYTKKSPWNEWWWKDNIKPIQAEKTEVVEPQAKPANNSVVIEWSKVEGAVVYTILIKKGNELICTVSFNEQGQLLNITFAAPAHNGNSRQTSAAMQTATGWQYTIGGLEPDTEYSFTVIAKNNNDAVIVTYTKDFRTLGEESGSGDSGGNNGNGNSGGSGGGSGSGGSGGSGDSGGSGGSGGGGNGGNRGLDDVQADGAQGAKVLIDGQIYIRYNGQLYNLQGARVK